MSAPLNDVQQAYAPAAAFVLRLANLAPEDKRYAPLQTLLVALHVAVAEGKSALKLSEEQVALLDAVAALVERYESGVPALNRPLVLMHHLLYTQRQFFYEYTVAQFFMKRLQTPSERCENLTFPAACQTRAQKLAFFCALKHPLTLICGGPGTGKTSIVQPILCEMLRRNPALRPVLCAPTGKAQIRLKSALSESAERNKAAPEMMQWMSEIPSMTVHRLLGYCPGQTTFSYNKENPLPYDVVIFDEFSMASLRLTANLCLALRDNCKLLLLGDSHQLPSVDGPSLLGDLCFAAKSNVLRAEDAAVFAQIAQCEVPAVDADNAINGAYIELDKNYRFPENHPVAYHARAICQAADEADCQRVIAAMKEPQYGVYEGVSCFAVHAPDVFEKQWKNDLSTPVNIGDCAVTLAQLPQLAAVPTPENLRLAFGFLDNFKILCAVRNGRQGTRAINTLCRAFLSIKSAFAPGIPIMITVNDYENHLFNGDIGLMIADETDAAHVRCCFRDEQEPERYRYFTPGELMAYEDVFAMTVHKSQGSGFKQVITLLPEDELFFPVLSRELLYTALTRTKEHFTLFATDAALLRALTNRCDPGTSLRDMIRAVSKP